MLYQRTALRRDSDTAFRLTGKRLPDLIPILRVDAGEPAQVRQVRRRDRDGITWQTGERRLTGNDGIGIQSVGRSRGHAGLSEESPELRGLDDCVGRQGQVVKAAAWIESVIEASQAADGADSDEFAANLVMGDFGDDNDRGVRHDRIQPSETTSHLRLAGRANNQAKRPAVQQNQPRHD